MKLKLIADQIRVRGPKVDGGYVITLEVGEYEVKTVAQLMSELNTGNVVNITLEQENNG